MWLGAQEISQSMHETWWRHQLEAFSALLAFVRGIHRSPVNSPHKGQWRRALMFSLIWAWTNGWVNNLDAGDLKRHRTLYDVTAMKCSNPPTHIIATRPQLVVKWQLVSNVDVTHYGHHRTVDIFHMTILHVFPWMKMYDFPIKVHWNIGDKSSWSLVQVLAWHQIGAPDKYPW